MKKLNKELQQMYNQYRDVILSEGWCLALHQTDKYEILPIKKAAGGYYDYDFGIARFKTKMKSVIKNARNHGIICDNKNIVIKFDKTQFEKTLYLWQAKELGIL